MDKEKNKMSTLTDSLSRLVIVTVENNDGEIVEDIYWSYDRHDMDVVDFYQKLKMFERMKIKVEVYQWDSPTLSGNGTGKFFKDSQNWQKIL